ncbi:MAG: hypothetical protein ABIU85_00170 [Methylotenera sp.]
MKTILIRYLLVAAAAGFIAYKFTTNHYVAKIATIKAEQAEQAAALAKSNYDNLRAANSLADVLSNTLANKEHEINAITLEKTREIKNYSTGNICFNAELTRLLNTPFDPIPPHKATSTFDAEGRGFTTSEGKQEGYQFTGEALTDTDVAEWITNAQGKYETCRSRLSGLIDFENGIKD